MPAINRKPIFDAVRVLRNGQGYTQPEVILLDKAIDEALAVPLPISPIQPSTATVPSKFALSQASLDKLARARRELSEVAQAAIKVSLVDFRVQQTTRTLEEQRDNVRRGTSKTMKSKHLPQADGKAWAMDLLALVNGQVSWDFEHYYFIARAVDRAATALGYAKNIRWGAVWDRTLADFDTISEDKTVVRQAYLDAIEDYKKRHAGKDFLDGPHFEWVP